MACVFMKRLLNMVCILLLYLLMHLVPQWLYPFMIFIINKVCIYFSPKSYFDYIFGGEYFVPSSSLLGVALASLLQAIHPFFDTLFGWIYIRSKWRIKSRLSWFTCLIHGDFSCKKVHISALFTPFDCARSYISCVFWWCLFNRHLGYPLSTSMIPYCFQCYISKGDIQFIFS